VRWTASIRADARAVHAWWTDPKRLEEMKARWEAQRDFTWQELRDGSRVDVAAGWTTGAGTEVALRVTFDRLPFPRACNKIVQLRRHLSGHQDETRSTTAIEFVEAMPSLTQVRVTTERERSDWRWWELRPPLRWARDAHARRRFAEQVSRCEAELAGTPRPVPPSP
jgi:hypothetical protein